MSLSFTSLRTNFHYAPRNYVMVKTQFQLSKSVWQSSSIFFRIGIHLCWSICGSQKLSMKVPENTKFFDSGWVSYPIKDHISRYLSPQRCFSKRVTSYCVELCFDFVLGYQKNCKLHKAKSRAVDFFAPNFWRFE